MVISRISPADLNFNEYMDCKKARESNGIDIKRGMKQSTFDPAI